MAVGDVLTSPETGWKRFDGENQFVEYNVGSWTQDANSSAWNSTRNYSNANPKGLRFNFEGTKLRIIGTHANNRSDSITITIDGVSETFSQYDSSVSTVWQVLSYEKTGLDDKIHYVEIYDETSNYLSFDAVDIDETGNLSIYDEAPYISKILLSSNSGDVLTLKEGGYTENLVPTMTSSTAPKGEVSASVSYDSTRASFHAFDDNESTYWGSYTQDTAWIQYKFTQKECVKKMSITSSLAYDMHTPIVFQLLASNTGDFAGEEVVLLDVNESSGFWNSSAKETKYWEFENNNNYLYYRVYMTDKQGSFGQYVEYGVSGIEFFGLIPDWITKIPSLTEQDFLEHGMDSLSIDPTLKFTKKQYIMPHNQLLGSGHKYSQQIDMNNPKVNAIRFK